MHSISAGLDYPGVGPEHSFWKDSGRVRYTSVNDDEALAGFFRCSQLEGILPALETAHAVVETMQCRNSASRDVVVVCFSGRGDKDCFEKSPSCRRDHHMNAIDALFKATSLPGAGKRSCR